MRICFVLILFLPNILITVLELILIQFKILKLKNVQQKLLTQKLREPMNDRLYCDIQSFYLVIIILKN